MTWTYYTTSTSLALDLTANNLDLAEGVGFGAAHYLKGQGGVALQVSAGDVNADLSFNSNPAKPRNRELLDWRVREALEYATPRSQLVNIVFGGYAQPWANIIDRQAPAYWRNPKVQPLPYDPAAADRILNGLGYRLGANGIRQVPATGGRYAQPAHPMSYGVILPDSLPFDGDREFLLLHNAYLKIGVDLTEISGGDASSTYAMITAKKYTSFDMSLWYWTGYLDPSFMLSIVTRSQWFANSDTGMDDPTYDRWWQQQESAVSDTARQALVWKMEAYLARVRPYIILANLDSLDAYRQPWVLDPPALEGYCKCYYTDVHTS
jgi:peptide/nickel transport system substrate-binding protein